MRVSSYQLFDSSLLALQQQSVDALKWQRQVASGNKFQKASQGAVQLSRGVEILFTQSRYAMHKENQAYVAGMLTAADQQLGDALGAINQLKAIGVRANNGSFGVVGLTALAAEARVAYQALEQLALANDAAGERILLTNTTLPVFSAPKVTVETGTIGATVALGEDVIFQQAGQYDFKVLDQSYTVLGNTMAQVELKINGVGPQGKTDVNDVFVGTYYQNEGRIVMNMAPGSFANLSLENVGGSALGATFSLQADPLQAKVSDSSRLHAAGEYQIELVNFNAFSSASGTVEAYLKRNGVRVKDTNGDDLKITVGNGITRNVDALTGLTTTTLNFGTETDQSTAKFRNFSVVLTGDVTKLSASDTLTFNVAENVREPEVEPGVTIAAGIGWRQAFGDGTGSTVDVLYEANRLVELLEASAPNGTLGAGFSSLMGKMEESHTQVLNAQVLSGALGARLDQAVEALESKSTEVEAFRSRLLDADIAEASAGLVRAQTLLEAARSIFTRLETTNLFQKLLS